MDNVDQILATWEDDIIENEAEFLGEAIYQKRQYIDCLIESTTLPEPVNIFIRIKANQDATMLELNDLIEFIKQYIPNTVREGVGRQKKVKGRYSLLNQVKEAVEDERR